MPSGKKYIDLHIHTVHSDGFLDRAFLESFLGHRQHLIAVTDHNEIAGSVDLIENTDLNVVPGIEIGCQDGFELLVYFQELADLKEFFYNCLEPYKNNFRMAKTTKDYKYYLDILEGYDVFIAIPHINGYLQKNFINNKDYIYEVIKRVDGIEVHNNTLTKKQNKTARKLQKKFNKKIVFGSDAHTQKEIFYFQNYLRENKKSIIESLVHKVYELSLFQKHLAYIFS
ncbi:PHP domain-containing protein [Halanaerobiaceae bacterium Z-7014]|uniref:PHP domain-containing protein n=1 Tax=Halonatronomonas betaini TaxID=2778430 RepID=A0A931ASH8_9FIRM|nr:PHP domain-containing protein [Halonatronomonas betaini]MBF8437329.1 PHP domain-containing protein [Halonatronomonas betaini]